MLAIKTGASPYLAMAAEIEGLLEAVEAEAARSSLPASPDQEWIDDFVAEVYAREVFSIPQFDNRNPDVAHEAQ